MLKLGSAFVLVGALLAVTYTAEAQQKRVSPHDTISAVINGNRVTITYGRPYTKDPKSGEVRKIFGGKVVPYGAPWRAGADEATILTTQMPLQIGDATIPAGAYTLYVVPEEKGVSKLAFSKKVGGWGIPVDTKNDLTRVDLKTDKVDAPVEQFTIALDKGGVLKMTWENTQFSVPFSVKK